MRELPMQLIKEVLRFKYLNKLSNRKIQTLLNVSKSAISNYCKVVDNSELSVEQLLKLNDKKLNELFYPNIKSTTFASKQQNEIDFEMMHTELKQKGMTRALLWEEYIKDNPSGYSYSQFNRKYNAFSKTINPSMRQIHYAGDKLFVDFSGLTMPIVNKETGEIKKAQIFVSVLGASGYTFVHAVMSQSTEDFIECHNEAFYFYGGVPNVVVPDNLKAAVISNKKGVVKLNKSYADMARHYGVAIVPARPYKPQDKSKAELGVKAVQRWMLMRLRKRTFFEVHELNEAMSELLDLYNEKIYRRFKKSRNELFEILDKQVLHPLRANRYLFKEHKQHTVPSDCHLEIDGSGYSVPFKYIGKRVDIWYSRQSVTISYQSEVIANHLRMSQPYHDSTVAEHMPKDYQYQYTKWNPDRIINWATNIGNNTTKLMQKIMANKSHPMRGLKPCMAILSFSNTYGKEAVELASTKANELNLQNVKSIESMLKRKTYLPEQSVIQPVDTLFNAHENIRGSQAYQ